MKRFQFRQESLLRVRKQLRRQAEIRLSQARTRLAAAQQQQQEFIDDLERVNAEAWQSREPNQTVSWRWQQSIAYLNNAIHTCQLHIDRCQAAVTKCALELRDRTIDVESLDALRLRQWRQHQVDLEASRQAALDEVAMGQWYRNLADSEKDDDCGQEHI